MLLDVMVNGRFYCQIDYTKRGFPEMIDGEIEEVHDYEEIQRFVEECKPSLKGRDYRIEFTDNKVFRV